MNQKNRDFSFKDLISRFQSNARTSITEDKNEIITNEINKNIENKILDNVENKILEDKKNEVIININEKINDVSTDVNTNIENNEKVLEKADKDELININNTVENLIVAKDEVVKQGSENINIDIIDNNVEAGQAMLKSIEKENDKESVLEPNINPELKAKVKKPKVELTKTTPIDKSQIKFIFYTGKAKRRRSYNNRRRKYKRRFNDK
jgi:hypothetical protein